MNVETDRITLRIRIVLIPPDTSLSVKHRLVSNRGAGGQPAWRTTGAVGGLIISEASREFNTVLRVILLELRTENFSRKGAKSQSAAAFLRVFFASLRLCARNLSRFREVDGEGGAFA